MRLKLICCNVFFREVCYLLASSPHVFDVEFIELGEHARPERLRTLLQRRIDEISSESPKYDAVLFGYGLCGRSIDGLEAKREKLVFMRAHDCCTVLLGSREEFVKHFGDMPSTPFSSTGFIDHGSYIFDAGELSAGTDMMQDLIEKYGEEDAKYIWETMHPKLDGKLQPVYFIRIPEIPCETAEAKCRERAAGEEREVRILSGNLQMLRQLVHGDWSDENFLILSPGQRVSMIGDQKEVIRSL